MLKQYIFILGFVLLAFGSFAQKTTVQANTDAFRFAGAIGSIQVWDSVLVEGKTTNTLALVKPIEKLFYHHDDERRLLQEDVFISHYLTKDLLVDVPKSKTINSFDELGQKTQSIIYTWSEQEQEYIQSEKHLYTYPLTDYSLKTIYTWNKEEWVAQDSVRYFTKLNQYQNPVEVIFSSHQGVWLDSLKETYSYDLQNRLIEKQVYDLQKISPIAKERITLNYDPDGNIALVKIEHWNGQKWEIPQLTIDGYKFELKAYASYTMLYRPLKRLVKKETKQTHEAKTADGGFYVNAGNDEADVTIYTLSGNLLLNKQVKGTSYIATDSLGKGTFVVRITINEKVLTKKLHIN